ncbi:HAD-IA family hydrolase [Nocardioides sp. CCNWLW239]|uniref:HAD family hydrolase n=1 Tax=Nocardioides sp. CCNWLW239 TaxID=3128902 RepID=UPI003018609D
MTTDRVRHVLFDADGVLQHLPGGWYAAAEPFLGERSSAFLHAAWAAERPLLTGGGADFVAMLKELLVEHGSTASVAEVYTALWGTLDTVAATVDVVHRVRAAGYGVHLATNQASHRAELMRTTLGYDDLFDVSCYSYDLGVAKPDPSFFLRAADRIAADPSEILLVDDSAGNVEAARSAGLSAIQWAFDSGDTADHTGDPSLLEQLKRHGVRL